MADKEFIERESLPDFSGFGELPEDLRNTGAITLPDGDFMAPMEGDFSMGMAMGIPAEGGTERMFMQPIPAGTGSAISWSTVNYLPRFNFESFRSQKFYGGGRALLPADPTTFIDLLVAAATSIVTETGGTLVVPSGFAAVITGLRQWVGDANAFNKTSGGTDDIVWRLKVAGSSVFSMGNFPFIASSDANESKQFVIVNENAAINVAVMNRIATTDPLARDIPVYAIVSGHWFPIDELDDIFRNK